MGGYQIDKKGIKCAIDFTEYKAVAVMNLEYEFGTTHVFGKTM